MSRLRAGELKHLVQLDAPIERRDALGAVEKAYQVQAILPAKVKRHAGNEKEDELIVDTVSRLSVWVRFFPRITTEYRLHFEGTRYRILSVTPFGRYDENLEILCETSRHGHEVRD